MGCGGPSVESKVPQSWLDLFAAMRLTKSEVQQMYNIFRKVDLDGSGSVDIVELLTLFDIERTRFTEQVFTVFDSDGSGKVDFKEFVLAVWNYCTIGKASLGMCPLVAFRSCGGYTKICAQIFSHSTCTTGTRAGGCRWKKYTR